MPLRAPRGFIREDDPKVAPIGHPAPPWLVNYADLMTEMVAFFVILYALGAALNRDVQQAQQQINEMIEKGEMAGKVEVTKEGIRITMEEGIKEEGKLPFFEIGSADLTPTMTALLEKLYPIFNGFIEKKHEVIVEGHTDSIPITGRYSSNWELSTARATNVLRYLSENLGLKSEWLGAIGYGEFRPSDSRQTLGLDENAPILEYIQRANDSEERRRKNRRVVFFIKNPPQTFKPETVKSITD